MDKQKQIEEMAKIIYNQLHTIERFGLTGEEVCQMIAKELLKHYQPKIPESSVVISKEEYTTLKLIEKYHIKPCGKISVTLTTEELEEIGKQAIEEFIQAINKEYKLSDYKDEIFFTCWCEDIERIAKEFGVEIKE